MLHVDADVLAVDGMWRGYLSYMDSTCQSGGGDNLGMTRPPLLVQAVCFEYVIHPARGGHIADPRFNTAEDFIGK